MKNSLALILVALVLLSTFGCSASTKTEGGEFIGALPLDIVSMDPHIATDDSGNFVKPLIFEGLVAMGSDGAWHGVLASSWETSADGLSWVFHLREGVLFHNGRELVAADVVYSLNRILNEENGAIMFSTFDNKIANVLAIDKYAVSIELNSGGGTFLSELGLGSRVAIIPREAIDETGAMADYLGTGPYKLMSWSPGFELIAERNNDYWGEVSSISRVRFITILDDATRLAALVSGEVDWIRQVPFEQVEYYQNNTEDDIELGLVYQNNIVRLNFNSTRPPLDNPLVRQAIAYAIDKDEINELIYFGLGTVHNQPFLEDTFMYLDVDDIYRNSDISRAQALLNEAGYSEGLELTAIHPIGFLPGSWELFASQLSKIGITVNVEFIDIPQLVQRAQALDYDLMGDQQTQIFHWDRTFSYFDRNNSSNFWVGGYEDPELVPLIEAARNQADLEIAKAAYTHILAEIQADAGTLFILSLPEIQAWNSEVLLEFFPSPTTGLLVWPNGGLNYIELDK